MASTYVALFFMLMTQIWEDINATTFGPEDHCMLGIFEPKCKDEEVIIIDSALYGRMSVGKCVKSHEEKIGCFTDVRPIIDSLCSGRQSCTVRPVNPLLLATNPCQTESLSLFLRLSYKCTKVSKPSCQTPDGATVYLTNGFLSTDDFDCPVKVTVPNGQLINFTMYNFIKGSDIQSAACYEVATIKDNTQEKSVHVCPSDARLKVVHISSTSSAIITFVTMANLGLTGRVLFHFEASGCPKPRIPQNAYIIREGDTATIACNSSDTSWTTICRNNVWTNLDRECPNSGWSLTSVLKTESDFPYGIFLTSVIGVGLGILIGGFLLFLAINAFQRYQRRKYQYEPPPMIPDPDYKVYDTAKLDFIVSTFGTGRCTLPKNQMATPDSGIRLPSIPSDATMKRLSKHDYEKPNYGQ